MDKKVLVTGATGCIGRHCLQGLISHGCEVHAVSHRVEAANQPGVTWHNADLFNVHDLEPLVSAVMPTHLLHLAWYVIPGKSAEAEENYVWVQSSLELLRAFHKVGGKRIVVTGSSFEYDWQYGYCSEELTPKVANTFYGRCKHGLHLLLQGYCLRNNISYAWPRVFFLYGPHEHPDRIVPFVIRSLLAGQLAKCSHGRQIRDYLHVQDVADGIVQILDSNVQGAVNVGSGTPITLREIVTAIGKKLDAMHLLQLGAIPSRVNDAPLVVADVTRLTQEVGWEQKYDLDSGLDQTIAWWKEHLKVPAAAAQPTA